MDVKRAMAVLKDAGWRREAQGQFAKSVIGQDGAVHEDWITFGPGGWCHYRPSGTALPDTLAEGQEVSELASHLNAVSGQPVLRITVEVAGAGCGMPLAQVHKMVEDAMRSGRFHLPEKALATLRVEVLP